MTTTPAVETPRSTGRRYLWYGLGLTFLGAIAYLLQVAVLKHLTTPWYVPVLTTIGAGLAAYSLWQRPTFWRGFVGLLLLVLAGFEWAFLFATRLPAYDGPVTIDQPVPAFRTKRADGSPFTFRDLQTGQNTVLLFFRGRW
jgi:hypothetical protein